LGLNGRLLAKDMDAAGQQANQLIHAVLKALTDFVLNGGEAAGELTLDAASPAAKRKRDAVTLAIGVKADFDRTATVVTGHWVLPFCKTMQAFLRIK
jgi:hypothetical protein